MGPPAGNVHRVKGRREGCRLGELEVVSLEERADRVVEIIVHVGVGGFWLRNVEIEEQRAVGESVNECWKLCRGKAGHGRRRAVRQVDVGNVSLTLQSDTEGTSTEMRTANGRNTRVKGSVVDRAPVRAFLPAGTFFTLAAPKRWLLLEDVAPPTDRWCDEKLATRRALGEPAGVAKLSVKLVI